MSRKLIIRLGIMILFVAGLSLYTFLGFISRKNLSLNVRNGNIYQLITKFDENAQKLDSLNRILRQKENDYNSYKQYYNSKIYGIDFPYVLFGNFGLGWVSAVYSDDMPAPKDTLESFQYFGQIQNRKPHAFLELQYLGINTDLENGNIYPKNIYYAKDGFGYIAHLMKKSYKGEHDSIVEFTYTSFKKLPYLYSPKNEIMPRSILIPVNTDLMKSVFKILVYGMMLLNISANLSIFYFSIVILVNISLKKVFNDTNLFYIMWCCIACFTCAILPYVITGIFYLIYYKDFYPDVKFTQYFWAGDYKSLMACIVYLLLFLAFRKGKKLQQEQDLTI